jgi:predicted glutamine amidotransferase
MAVMGHTRMTTQGNKKQNYNNHPFAGHADKEFAFAHNGVLWNDKELRKDGTIPNSYIDTDSYIGVQLIEKQGKLDFDKLHATAKILSYITSAYVTLEKDGKSKTFHSKHGLLDYLPVLNKKFDGSMSEAFHIDTGNL